MENKYLSVVMILVLVVMAAIGGEAVDQLCEVNCKSASCGGGRSPEECFLDCIKKQCKQGEQISQCELKCKSACRGGHDFRTLPECYTDCVGRQCGFPPKET
ncbi:hypothetical protein ISN44_As13g026950 [Arabidopsis suecica]|uniref:Plant thionin family protein n=1 Tax=Arabidopsis suecica TaxID=45249 RepID=A0A8T1XVN9_ARASU|nr:hypothetical protein ISN44_As13g026950 [Arabidopsis suecica]